LIFSGLESQRPQVEGFQAGENLYNVMLDVFPRLYGLYSVILLAGAVHSKN
jgi:hypothetical protein